MVGQLATLIQGDVEVRVRCDYSVQPGPLLSWRGTFWDPEPPYQLEPGDAVLRLEDGREARVLVNRVNVGTEGETGLFVGNGPPP